MLYLFLPSFKQVLWYSFDVKRVFPVTKFLIYFLVKLQIKMLRILYFCLIVGPSKPGTTRQMMGSPRQLENAVPTSRNPHGVWV